MCLGVFLLGFILLGTLCASWTWLIFSFPFREVFSYYLFKYFLRSFLSLISFWDPIMWFFMHLMLSQMSLTLSSFLFILFSIFCSVAVISTILSSRSFISWWLAMPSLPGSFLPWCDPVPGPKGSMVGLMAASKRVYIKGDLPKQLLPVPLSLWWVPANAWLHKRPSNTGRQFWLGFLWGCCSFPLSLAARKVSFVPSKTGVSVFSSPVEILVIKSRWLSKSDSLGIPSPFVGSPGLETWPSQPWRTSLVLLFSNLLATHPAGMGFHFIVIVPLLSSCCGFLFVSGHGISFFDRFQRPPLHGCSTAGCDCDVLTGGDEPPSTLPSWTWSTPSVVLVNPGTRRRD